MKARELGKTIGEQHTLSSGVTVTVVPFPAGLWESINSRALRDRPDPLPPKKEIATATGPELVDDLNDPAYLASLREAEAARSSIIGEAVIDLCVRLELAEFEPVIKRLEKYTEPYPVDPDDRRVRFLTDYVLRTRGDYETIMVSATTQMTVSNAEVADRLRNFQREVEGGGAGGAQPSGATQVERLDVQPAAYGDPRGPLVRLP